MRKAVQECGCHPWTAERRCPFAERQVHGHQHAVALVEPGEQVEQQRTTNLTEREVTRRIENHEVHAHQPVCQRAGLSLCHFGLPRVDGLYRR